MRGETVKVPGIIYSLILALGAWVVEYFSTGGIGAGFPWAPVLIAAVPVALKFFTAATTEAPPEAQARGMESAQSRSYTSKVMWG